MQSASPAWRSLLATVAFAVLLTLLALTAGATSGFAAAGEKPPAREEPAKAPKADRDGDKIFEDLQARATKLAPGERVEVLVALEAAATAVRVADIAGRAGGV